MGRSTGTLVQKNLLGVDRKLEGSRVQQLAPRCLCQVEPLTNEPLSRQAPGEKLLPRGSDSDLGAPLWKEALDRETEVKIRTRHGWGEGS